MTQKLTFSLTIERKKNFYLTQAKILKSSRAATKYTQRAAASKLGISAATLCGWERTGCRDVSHCCQLASLYGQDLALLLPSTYNDF